MHKFSAIGAVALAVAGLAITLSNASNSAIAADLGGRAVEWNGFDAEFRDPDPRQSDPRRYFYVRGDVGIGNYSNPKFSQSDLEGNGGSFISQSIEDTVYQSVGIGVQMTQRLRFDLTGEYRSTANIKAMDNLTAELTEPAGSLQANTLYQGDLTSYVGMLNGYVDLFHHRGFTPYVGAGVGFAHNTMSGLTTITSSTFTDTDTGAQIVESSAGTSRSNSQTNFAWALMAGTSFDLSPNAKLDIGYRYLNLGSGISASSSLLDCLCGTVGEPVKISDLDAHEIRIGVRWALGANPTRPNNGALK